MKQQLLITIAAVVLVGCSTNEITVANSGNNVWQEVEVSAGGNRFAIGKLKAGEFKTIRFRSKQECGGLITGEINGEKLEYEFGYYTPNLSSEEAIFLNNSHINDIEIVNMDSTVQTLDELFIEKRKSKNNSASKNIKILSDELKPKEK